nr:uncharacterized protein LOC112287514 [Physcomitrium patens]|eukprot:XP_024386332.1 uncharacterized protein LOC112287514 [Physcomitrella patens]
MCGHSFTMAFCLLQPGILILQEQIRTDSIQCQIPHLLGPYPQQKKTKKKQQQHIHTEKHTFECKSKDRFILVRILAYHGWVIFERVPKCLMTKVHRFPNLKIHSLELSQEQTQHSCLQ